VDVKRAMLKNVIAGLLHTSLPNWRRKCYYTGASKECYSSLAFLLYQKGNKKGNKK